MTYYKPKLRHRHVWNGVNMEDEYQVTGPHGKILSRHNLDEIVRMAEQWIQREPDND